MKEIKNTKPVAKVTTVKKLDTPAKIPVATTPEVRTTTFDSNIAASIDSLFDSMVTKRPPALDFEEACKLFKFYANNVVLKAVTPRYVCVLGKKAETLVALRIDEEDTPFIVDQKYSPLQPILIRGDEYDKKVAEAKAEAARKSHKKNPAKKDK